MRLKYLSLNLWLGGKLMPEVLDFLAKEQADIVALQEVYNGSDPKLEDRFRSLEVLQKHLHYPYSHFSPAFSEKINGKLVEQGNAVLSRFPILNVAAVFFDIPYRGGELDPPGDYTQRSRNLEHVAINCEGQTLHVLNTQGIWGNDGDDNPRRLAMADTIVGEIQKYDLVILSGDFNVRPETKTIGKIEQHLRNVFKGELTTTFNMRQKTEPMFASVVVDMIFVSPYIQVVDHYCPDVDASDHLPLVGVFEI